jgi:SSS family transporter
MSAAFARRLRPVRNSFASMLRLLAIVVLFACALPVAATSLTHVLPGALPTLPGKGELQGLVVADGTPVAVRAGALWQLDAAGKGWLPARWKGTPPAHVTGVFGNGATAYAFTGPEPGVATGVARVHLSKGALALEALPALPAPMQAARGAVLASTLFITGVAGEQPRLLKLTSATPRSIWSDVRGWPVPGATATTLVGQTGALFATFGDPASADGQSLWRWTAEQGWRARGKVPGIVVEGSGRAIGQAHILYLVRDPAQSQAASLRTFQTITGSWAVLPGATAAQPMQPAAWRDGILWAQTSGTGAIELHSAEIQPVKVLLTWVDWLVIIVYLGSMIGIGLYFYLREKRNSTSNFFVGGRSIPFWAAGVSLYAANTSSISFIAIPAKSFETNWQYLTNNLIAVVGLMFVAVWIVPLLRRLDLMSVFSYLETRFHPAIRMLASALCILTQIGSRMSVILFLPALAIATITGISVTWSVVLMGGFTIIYTAMGGMKAVIWTDFVQVIVKMGGAIFAIGFIVWKLKGGVGEFVDIAAAQDKMHLLDFSFDLTKATVWGFLFLVLFDVVLTFPKDQVLMQRTLSTKSDREAGRSIWAFAAIMIPGGFVFYMIGTALYVYYKANPERMNPVLPIDATFPLFIAAELPRGVTGLIIAGIFAAAMATLSGIMNSVATLVSVDFYDRLVKDGSQKKSVFFAEIMTVVVGLIGIGAALLLSRFDIHSLFDVSIELAGLLGGGFAGAYTLGMFTRRANSPGVAIGIGSSIAFTFIAWSFKLVHPYFYLAISIMLCIVIGYLASLLFPAPTRSLDGLTIYKDRPAPAAPSPAT